MAVDIADLVEPLRRKLGDIRAEQVLGFRDDTDTAEYLTDALRRSLAMVEVYWGRTVMGTGEASTKTLDGEGFPAIWTPDFTDLTTVKVDRDEDGVFETELTVGTHVLAQPTNPDVAYFKLELRRSAPISCFPKARQAVEITATFGWPSLPDGAEDPILRLASNMFLQDQQNRRGRVVAVGDFDVQLRGSRVFTQDIKDDLAQWRMLRFA